LEDASQTGVLPDGITAYDILNTWGTQAGFPLITASTETENILTLNQVNLHKHSIKIHKPMNLYSVVFLG